MSVFFHRIKGMLITKVMDDGYMCGWTSVYKYYGQMLRFAVFYWIGNRLETHWSKSLTIVSGFVAHYLFYQYFLIINQSTSCFSGCIVANIYHSMTQSFLVHSSTCDSEWFTWLFLGPDMCHATHAIFYDKEKKRRGWSTMVWIVSWTSQNMF